MKGRARRLYGLPLMSLEHFVTLAREAGASDLHLEGGMPPALRIRGELKMSGEPVAAAQLTEIAREVIGEAWPEFLERRSYDLARVISGVRCRLNVLQTTRGVGFVVRLLSSFQATLKKLNLHPALRKLIDNRHGLIVVSGPTGSGKSTTLAALIQEINLSAARHIVTIESPTEYVLTPRQSLIRQREIGRHTPSFAQALVDSLREDPDVIMVGEMREPETMRLTLNAAETGHLVLTTVHSATCSEALQRIVSAFPAEVQGGICSQLAECLVAVVCQRLRYRADLGMLVPECEILMASSATRGVIRQGQFYKLGTVLDGGGQDGSWSFARYCEWLEAKNDWVMPAEKPELSEVVAEPVVAALPVASRPAARPVAVPKAVTAKKPAGVAPVKVGTPPGVVEIDDEEDPADILAQLDRSS
jgi:twitching motility protein PilT